MGIDERNYHMRLQEYCDCFLETDPKVELEAASRGVSGTPNGDPDELALKFLGLAIFYGASEKAKKISLERSGDGQVRFTVEAKGKYQLPPPTHDVAGRIISIARAITHIDEDQGEEVVSLGLRNERMEVTFQFGRRDGNETLAVLFPEL